MTVLNTQFTANSSSIGIVGSSSVNTNGGAIYIGSVNYLNVSDSKFEGVSSVTSGGGMYVNQGNWVLIQTSLFNNITVATSGGVGVNRIVGI
jgi:hypothetical protein